MFDPVKMLSALAEPTRIGAMRILWDGGEHCVCELMVRLEASQSRMSRHMAALKAAGLDASDIIKLNAYVVDLPANMTGYRDARLQFFPPGTPQPASTLIGVSSLALEGQMIEVEAIAVTR